MSENEKNKKTTFKEKKENLKSSLFEVEYFLKNTNKAFKTLRIFNLFKK